MTSTGSRSPATASSPSTGGRAARAAFRNSSSGSAMRPEPIGWLRTPNRGRVTRSGLSGCTRVWNDAFDDRPPALVRDLPVRRPPQPRAVPEPVRVRDARGVGTNASGGAGARLVRPEDLLRGAPARGRTLLGGARRPRGRQGRPGGAHHAELPPVRDRLLRDGPPGRGRRR